MSTLDRWLGGGLRTVLLPSGTAFRIRIPDVEEMLAKGLIPPALRQIALKFGASGVNPETLDTEGLATLLSFMRTLVAHSLRYVWEADPREDRRWQQKDFTGEPWQPVTVTVGMLEEGSIDGDDYAALQGIVTRQFTPTMITALTLKELGMLEPAEAERQIEGERSGTTDGWATFRRQRRSADAGDAGESVEGPPVGDARAEGAGGQPARVPARRRATRSARRG